eukprot:UN13451
MTREEGVLKFNLANWKGSEDDVIINVIVPIINHIMYRVVEEYRNINLQREFNKTIPPNPSQNVLRSRTDMLVIRMDQL